MRDDLHHSLPQTHPWRKVVQVACAPGLGGDLVDTLTRAMWTRADWMKEAWGKELLQVLATPQAELFGTEQMERKLAALEASCPSPDARRALDIAFAETWSGQSEGSLKDRVVRASLEAGAEDGIEGAISWVADVHVETQVRQLRAALMEALLKCDLSQPPAPKTRTRKPSMEQGLGTVLDLQGV
ncbi:hypothetical protein ABXN37_14710 [Piscinibacter sakaiensis]|nr:hypothetical protein [Piscinibacter sakaiensis]